MKRRNFLIYAGSASLGATAVFGSGSFAQAEAHRRTKVEVAADSEAYLRVEQNPDSNWSDTDLTSPAVFTVGENGDGHLELTVDAVRNGTTTRFENVFRVCNAGKQCVCVGVERKEGGAPERVTFHDSSTGDSLEGEDSFAEVGVGDCVDVGFEVNAEGLEGRNSLLDTVVLRAETDCPCDESNTGTASAWADGEGFPGANPFDYFEYPGGSFTTDLVSGREESVTGTVRVEEVGNRLEIVCEADGGLVETHVALAGERPEVAQGNVWYENGWLNRGGNPVPGRFPVGGDHDGVGEVTHTVEPDDIPDYVAVHAVVRGGEP